MSTKKGDDDDDDEAGELGELDEEAKEGDDDDDDDEEDDADDDEEDDDKDKDKEEAEESWLPIRSLPTCSPPSPLISSSYFAFTEASPLEESGSCDGSARFVSAPYDCWPIEELGRIWR